MSAQGWLSVTGVACFLFSALLYYLPAHPLAQSLPNLLAITGFCLIVAGAVIGQIGRRFRQRDK
jgi:hypothetical protein